MSDGNRSDDDDDEGVGGGICLSAETMAALKDFAIQSGIPVLGNACMTNDCEVLATHLQPSKFFLDHRQRKSVIELSISRTITT